MSLAAGGRARERPSGLTSDVLTAVEHGERWEGNRTRQTGVRYPVSSVAPGFGAPTRACAHARARIAAKPDPRRVEGLRFRRHGNGYVVVHRFGVLSTAREFCQRSVNTTTLDVSPCQPPVFGVLSVLSVLSTGSLGKGFEELDRAARFWLGTAVTS